MCAQPAADMAEIVAREKSLFDSMPDQPAKIVEELQREMIRANRYVRPLSVVAFGAELAQGGSRSAAEARRTQLLRRLQSRAGSVLRQSDHFGRLDEDAVLVVLPETDHRGAEIVAEKLLAGGNTPNMIAQAKKTLSRVFVGWAQMSESDCDVAEFVERLRTEAMDFDAFSSRPLTILNG